MNDHRSTRSTLTRTPTWAGWVALAALAACLGGCATLKPQERAVLADPTMQFDTDAKHEAGLRHALDNREGAMGGNGVAGGGCGCN